jgi:hypothetical protein
MELAHNHQNWRSHTNICQEMAKNLQFVPEYKHSITTFLQMSVSYRLKYSRHSNALQAVEAQDIQGV